MLCCPSAGDCPAPLQPEIFFFLLMPPIIFEAGYTLKRVRLPSGPVAHNDHDCFYCLQRRFFHNIFTILLFAVVGTVISTFVVGLLCFAFAKAGVVNLATDSPLQSLLFGALISAGNPPQLHHAMLS